MSSNHNIESHFHYVDVDGNGLIDFAEFRRLLQKMGTNRSNDIMQHAFNAIDSDRSGSIDLDEFSIWWSRQTDLSAESQSAPMEDSPDP